MPKTKRFDVFLNCAFDTKYTRIREAIVFTIYFTGFRPRCALELDDSAIIRLHKIMRIIEESAYSIHDISRTELDSKTRLPRFNMPLELGIFLGCNEFGGSNHNKKSCLILDKRPYRYQKFISDIAGQDIKSHENNVEIVIAVVRNWLSNKSGKTIPGGKEIYKRYLQFRRDLPRMCKIAKTSVRQLTFKDYCVFADKWLSEVK